MPHAALQRKPQQGVIQRGYAGCYIPPQKLKTRKFQLSIQPMKVLAFVQWPMCIPL
jgi:hypothetical protein